MSPSTTPPRVSVTVISYNQAAFLEEAVESILAQNYPNLEIIISDDASTDASPAIIRNYYRRHPAILVPLFAYQNGGLIHNRDRAMKATTGDYIAWLDADDIMLPDRLAQQVDFMVRDPDCTVSYHNMDVFGADVRPGRTYHPDFHVAREGSYRELLKYGNFACSSSIMIRAGALQERSYHFESPTCSDYHFLIRLAARGRIRYLDQVLGRYRRHPAAATANGSKCASGFFDRRERAFNSLLTEFPDDRPLIEHGFARYFLSMMTFTMKRRMWAELIHYTKRFVGCSPGSIHGALAWRLKGRRYSQ
jgi:glycosyltransferase involved in cell wall biosynthesis